MTVSTLAVSTCILWGVCGFVLGVIGTLAFGAYLNRKAAKNKEKIGI